MQGTVGRKLLFFFKEVVRQREEFKRMERERRERMREQVRRVLFR